MTGSTDFSPGDHVKVIDGTFVGMRGIVVSRDEARAIWEVSGGQEPRRVATPEFAFVVLTLFARRVPVYFLNCQIEAVVED